MGFQWEVEPGLAFPELFDRYTKTIFVSGRRVAHQRAEEAEIWMKVNAPWQDQTGAARAGLHTQVLESPGVLAEIVFSHDPNLEYTVWLEVARGGSLGIISRAIDVYGQIFMRDVQRIVNLGLAAK
jgi:hypothetical protein